MNTKRLDWIDIAKGIGIILVVLGHTLVPQVRETGFAGFLWIFIYNFHMPLFFFLSGYLIETEDATNRIFEEFGLDGTGHIINGHVPVHQSEGENPLKCDGKVIMIDGGFSKPYHKVTGIAGYTLTYNSYGLTLTAHEPFESAEQVIQNGKDIVSNQVAVQHAFNRILVGDTDNGKKLKENIADLKELIEAYRQGIISEREK